MSAPLALEPRAFEEPLASLEDNVLIEYADGTLGVVERLPRADGVRGWRTGSGRPFALERLPEGAELGDVAIALHDADPVRVFALPEGHVDVEYLLGRLAARVGAVLLLGAGIVPLVAQGVSPWWWLLLGALAVAATRVRVPALAHHRLRYVTGQGASSLPALLDTRPMGRRAVARVDAVKAEYGRLVSDVVQRIESPALFDPTVPETRAFTTALIEWDDTHESLPPADAAELAARVEVTFRSARARAEALGMDHLPGEARDPARRALGALRIARDRGTRREERRTALATASRILAELRLPYLPRPTELAALTEGRTLRALPGRWEGP